MIKVFDTFDCEILLDSLLLNSYQANSKYEWVHFWRPELVWLTFSEKTAKFQSSKKFSKFLWIGHCWETFFWIIDGYKVLFMGIREYENL